MQFRSDMLFGIHDVLAERFLGNNLESARHCVTTYISVDRSVDIDLVLVRFKLGVTPQMTPDNELSQHFVLHRVHRVLYHAQHVESRQDGLCKLDVLLERDGRLLSS